MPKRRQPREIWADTRIKVLERDGYRCIRCAEAVVTENAHIDHIRSGLHGTNGLSNLRTLCRRCHVLRIDMRHRGMIAQSLEDGIIPADWRPLTWE